MGRIAETLMGNRLMARVLRSSSWILLGYGGGQAMRLASNLILARILFPEAFGLMALVTMVTVGLQMFSDVGIGPSIAQSTRGDDPDFLDTAWTIQVVRGLLLWLTTCLLAWPVAAFYAEADLALYLPLAGIALLISGFNPTRIETAHRHLIVGRLTILELLAQVIGLAVMVALALATGSVIALVIGGPMQALAKLGLTWAFLPGQRNRFRWERSAAGELIRFGKWIFLSTACYFLTSQGDRAVLGKFLTLETLGLYNIGYFLASFPMMLGHAVNQRVMIPVYREKPPAASAENRRKLSRMRFALTAGILGLLLLVALIGPWLVGVLYDDRYSLSGPIVTLTAISLFPSVIGMTYDQAALAAGESRGFFVYTAARAALQTALLLAGAMTWGLIGAIAALGVSMLLVYPVLIRLAVVHRAWDPRHDLVFGGLGAAVSALALWWNQEAVAQLAGLSLH